jgi:hypothetical protein
VAQGGGECSLGRCQVHGESDLGFIARGISPARGAPWWRASSGEERRCGAGVGRVVEVHRRGVELEEVMVGPRGGWRGRCSVDRGVVVGVGTTRVGVEAGCERKMKVKRGSSSSVVDTVGGEAAAAVRTRSARAAPWFGPGS